MASIQENGRKKDLGTYDTELEAAKEHDKKARKLGMPTNLPPHGPGGKAVKAQATSAFKGVSWDKTMNR